jgi:hypothetical protein
MGVFLGLFLPSGVYRKPVKEPEAALGDYRTATEEGGDEPAHGDPELPP